MTVRTYQDEVLKNDYGYPITLDTEVDIAASTSVKLKVIKPDETETEWSSGAIVYNTTKVRYTLQDGDLDQKGMYKINAYANNGTIWQRTGKTFWLEVIERGE